MGVLRVVLGDQLTTDISALSGLDRACDTVLMMEVAEEGTYVAHHKQKIVMILSAMRHFARGMRDHDIAVDYVALDDAGNTGSFTGEIARAVLRHKPEAIVMTEPGEWWLRETGEYRDGCSGNLYLRSQLLSTIFHSPLHIKRLLLQLYLLTIIYRLSNIAQILH